jgi:peroxiredoxin
MVEVVASAPPPRVGTPVPPFRLPSAQGSDVGPDDYRGQRNLVLWFSKGLF